MLATEAPSDPLARMRLPEDLWPELLHDMSSCFSMFHLPLFDSNVVWLELANMSTITRSCSANMCEQTTCVTKAEQGTRHKDRFFVTSTPEAQTRRLPRLLFDRHSILSLDWTPRNRLLPSMHDGKMLWAGISINCGCGVIDDPAALSAVCGLQLGSISKRNAQ